MEFENEKITAEKANKRNKFANIYFEIIDSMVVGFFIVLVLCVFFFRFFGVMGSSMEPTLHNGDRVVLSCLNYTPEHSDVVVLSQPNVYNDVLVKRVIGVAGDKIDIDFERGIVFVNDQPLVENYVYEPTYTREDFVGPVFVPQGKVFVMGDNRNNSADSRTNSIAMVDCDYIVGKVVLRIYPFGEWLVR